MFTKKEQTVKDLYRENVRDLYIITAFSLATIALYLSRVVPQIVSNLKEQYEVICANERWDDEKESCSE